MGNGVPRRVSNKKCLSGFRAKKKNESQVMSTGFLQTKLTIAVHDNNDFQYETGFQFQVENSAKFYLFKSAQSLQDNAFLNHRSM